MEAEKLMTIKDVAKFLGLSRTTLFHIRRQGRGPVYISCGKSVRYRRQDVQAWIEARKVEPRADG